MRIKISTDSTCDLSQELLEKYDIGLLPGFIVNDGELLRDGVDITAEDVYRQVDAGGEICSTAAFNAGDYEDYFRPWLEEYDAIVHFVISSEMSVSYHNACAAAEELKELGEVYPVDSRNLATGIGWQVLEAAELAEKGLSAKEIYEAMLRRREQMEVSFVLDRLDYMRKGGRCSGFAALGANLLSLKPCIEVKNGKMGVGKKYRGSLEKSLSAYVKDRLTGRDDIDYRRIFITHTRMDKALVQK